MGEPSAGTTTVVPHGAPPDLDERIARLRAVAEARGLHTLVLREPANLTWLLGARVHVPQTLDAACLDVVIELRPAGARLTVVANAIEAPRLRDTELADVPAQWQVVPWWRPRDEALPTGDGVGADRPLPGTEMIGGALAAARRILTAVQREQLTAVCADAAGAATAAALDLAPTMTEYAAAAVLARHLLDRALDPVVLLVAGDTRIGPHRHPLPTTAPLGARAMLVCVGRRHGLLASVTRIVTFGPPAGRDGYDRLLRVEQAFLDATRPGVPIGQAFAAGAESYTRHGFDPDEWHRHHQGGFTGHVPREYPAHAGSTDPIEEGCAIAWNPSGAGWKVEDTCLVGAQNMTPLCFDPAWPTVTVGGRARPDVLVR